MNRPTTRRGALASLVALLSMTVSACGGQTAQDSDGPVKIAVGVVPIADYSPVTYAASQGYFEDEGLDVTVQTLAGGAAALPALVSDDLQVSVTNWVSYLQARERNAPIVALPVKGPVGTPGLAGIYVGKKSAVKEPSDLVGRTIAMSELKTITELTSRVALAEAGVDPDEVKYTTLPFASILPAAESGEVDAGWIVEPYASRSKSLGMRPVLDLFAGPIEGRSTGGLITSRRFAQEHPDAVKRFSAAIDRAVEEMRKDPGLVEDTLIGMETMTEEQRGTTTLPTFGAAVSVEDLQFWADLLDEQGLLSVGRVDGDSAILDVD